MESEDVKGLPAEVERVRGQLEEWRGQRRNGQRIPEELWNAAVQVARRHGLNRVSRALSLDYCRLKRRSGQGESEKEAGHESAVPVVELDASARETGTACVVELEKGNGARLRVSVGDAATVDWCRLKEAFLGA